MRLNLGSGYRKLNQYINIDIRSECDPDMIVDLSHGLPFDTSTVKEVRAFDILEHIPIGRTVTLVEEIYRVLVPGGLFISMTPSTDGRGAWQDPTHVSFWNQNSFIYFMDDMHRSLYGIKAKFEGRVWDQVTDKERHIIHTVGELYAVK